MKDEIAIFTISLGSAAVILALAAVFDRLKICNDLKKNNPKLYIAVVTIFFGLLSMYGSFSGVQVGAAVPNGRNLAPLFAGLVFGPIPGICAGIIGGLFRWLVYGGPTGLTCGVACVLIGILGSVMHIILKNKEWRFSIPVGIVASVLAEAIHMGCLCIWGYSEIAKIDVIPFMLSDILAMMFGLYMYNHLRKAQSQDYLD